MALKDAVENYISVEGYGHSEFIWAGGMTGRDMEQDFFFLSRKSQFWQIPKVSLSTKKKLQFLILLLLLLFGFLFVLFFF